MRPSVYPPIPPLHINDGMNSFLCIMKREKTRKAFFYLVFLWEFYCFFFLVNISIRFEHNGVARGEYIYIHIYIPCQEWDVGLAGWL